MSELGIPVFAISAVLGLLGLISYKQGDGAQKFAFAVLLCLTVVTPVVDAIDGLDLDFESVDVNVRGDVAAYLRVTEEAFASGICEALASRYGLDRDCIEVRIYGFDFNTMSASRIRITLSGSAAAADTRAIKEYLENKNIGECEVRIELG